MIPYYLTSTYVFYDLDVVISVGDRDNDVEYQVVISVGDRDNDKSLRIGNVLHNNKIIPY